MGDPSIIKPELEQLLQEGTGEEIRSFLEEQHPYDIAEFISGLEPKEIARVVLALGKFAHDAYLRALKSSGMRMVMSEFPFAHGARHRLPRGPLLFDTYHPSQQNTFTGKLRPRDLDRVFSAVRRDLDRPV